MELEGQRWDSWVSLLGNLFRISVRLLELIMVLFTTFRRLA